MLHHERFVHGVDGSKQSSMLVKYKRLNQRKLRYIIAVCIMVIVFHEFGVFLHPLELDYQHFTYPLELDNLREIIQGHRNGVNLSKIAPINEYKYTYLIANEGKCRLTLKDPLGENEDDNDAEEEDDEDGGDGKASPGAGAEKKLFNGNIVLVFMIKSALGNKAARDGIRKSWGNEKRFSDVEMRRLFVLGNCEGLPSPEEADECNESVKNEQRVNGDIVQADFIDTYYNNTIKTMMAMKWIVTYCPKAHYVLFVDDDFYVSPKNLLRFIRNPYFDPQDLDRAPIPSRFIPKDDRIYSGFVFGNASPMRHKMSKWYTSLEEYPYEKYPPYVTAGAFLLSNSALNEMYYASLYTKHFRFDDIYVGILAKKIGLEPYHNKHFYYWKKKYDPLGYGKVIATHGFGEPRELLMVWEEQKSLGHA